MENKVYQPHDKDYKFKFKCCGRKIHNYIHKTKCKKIKFLDTEEAETGKRKDILYDVNGKIYHEENESTPITENKVTRFHYYNRYTVCDKSNTIKKVSSYCICTSKPSEEEISVRVEDNYEYILQVFYTKNINGQKVLNTLKDKVKKQEALTDDD